MKNSIKTASRFAPIIAVCFLVTYCGYNSVTQTKEEKQLEEKKTARKNEHDLLEKAFASQYDADFIHFKHEWKHRILACDLQEKIEANKPIAFFAFVDDIEKNEDDFIIHMTCPLSESPLCDQHLLFHLEADKSIVSVILNANSTRKKEYFKTLKRAPLLIVAQADKIVRATAEEYAEDEYGQAYIRKEEDGSAFHGYGKILSVKVRGETPEK